MNEEIEEMDRLQNGLIDALGLPTDYFGSPLTDSGSVRDNISQNLITLQPITLTYAYKQYGFIQTAIDQPIDDAFRGGIRLDSNTLSSDDLESLSQKMEDGNDWEAIKYALKWGRLFGGGGLIANTDQKPDTILSEKKLFDRKLKFYPTDRWECVSQTPNMTPELSDFLYHGYSVNNSRVMTTLGKEAPYYVRMRLQGWGMSMLEQVLPPLVQYLKSQNVLLELLDESKTDIIKIDGLATALMQTDGTAKIKKRVDTIASNKNYKSMITMDKNDEYEQKQISFSGLPELSREIRIMIASYLKMPVSKLFGVGSSGFSSGEDDLENYNSMVEGEVRTQALRLIKWVVDLRCMQLFGRKVDDLKINWSPLRVMSAEQEQIIKDRKVDNALKLLNATILTKRQAASKLVKEEALELSQEEIESIDNEYLEQPNIKIDEFI